MLKDIRELGKDLKRYFTEIAHWPELKFSQEDKLELFRIENVVDVTDHSMTFKIEDNHCIVPSQYILYSVFVKEFAIALREHLDVFESFKAGKSRNDIGREVYSHQFDLTSLNLDSWSSSIALKPVIDNEYNFGAKSLINGENGNYKVRGTSDFFTSVILKIINVPDASSSILGRLIFSLSGNREVYNYLERRFYRKLPFIIKEKKANRFAYKVFSYLFQYDDLQRLKSYIQVNGDDSFKSIKTSDISLTSIFKSSTTLQTNEDLSRGGKPRFFTTPIYLSEDNEFYYFSTEWTAGRSSRLDMDSLDSILKIHYPEFKINVENDDFIFKAIDAPKERVNGSFLDFKLEAASTDILLSGLNYEPGLISRYCASLLTKPFVILTGLSGSGKTRLAQAFAEWICEQEDQYCLVPVGADWTNREPLLGYPNALKPGKYVKPDSKVLDLLMRAENNPDRPYFLILDEMNLSHVERYFADFLSVMESDGSIPLYGNDIIIKGVPPNLYLQPNVFIVGTVNIDETTNMFSPKVLDRANTIEFRITKSNLKGFLNNQKEIDLGALQGKGAGMARSFVEMAKDSASATEDIEEIKNTLIRFFGQLKKAGAEFGYRSASEIVRLIRNLTRLNSEMGLDEKLDIAIMQKLLPKLHGSRRKLVGVLTTLAEFCVTEKIENVEKEVFNAEEFKFTDSEKVKFPLSLEKIARMHKAAIDNGFTSFAEA